MKHLISQKKLNKKTAHRMAMLNNMSCSLIEHGRIKTTVSKAKALRPYFEKLITMGRKNTLSSRRQLIAALKNEAKTAKLISDVCPQYKDRNGGYTRIIKTGPRSGDFVDMAIIELVGNE
ncbi:MAG: 50S ribosomal protein L17 [Rickettsiales bacterium]|jgi:large subunit ribosomal protein L17|nr:50S ribosomal protein L17 [Rickettsiales bacterium]